jgi:hypothetical protein
MQALRFRENALCNATTSFQLFFCGQQLSRAVLRNSNKMYRQMQFVVAGSLQDVFLMNGIEEEASTSSILSLYSGIKT